MENLRVGSSRLTYGGRALTNGSPGGNEPTGNLALMGRLGLRVAEQSLINDDAGHSYDLLRTVTVDAEGKPGPEVYFNIDALMGALSEELWKEQRGGGRQSDEGAHSKEDAEGSDAAGSSSRRNAHA